MLRADEQNLIKVARWYLIGDAYFIVVIECNPQVSGIHNAYSYNLFFKPNEKLAQLH